MAVFDASVVVAAMSPDEGQSQAVAALAPYLGGGGLVPGLWSLEVANVLLTKRRRGVLTPDHVDAVWRAIMRIPVETHHAAAAEVQSAVMPLAALHGLTSYDACYLELALRFTAPLATLDSKLIAAARAEGVTVL